MLEIEKKYRLTKKQRAAVAKKLVAVDARRVGEEFEQNTIYTNSKIDLGNAILRLRRVGSAGILTHKERLPTCQKTLSISEKLKRVSMILRR